MKLSEQAREVLDRKMWRGAGGAILGHSLPDGRTVAEALDEGEAMKGLALMLAREVAKAGDADLRFDPPRGWLVWHNTAADPDDDGWDWVPLADVDPEAAALLARLEATP